MIHYLTTGPQAFTMRDHLAGRGRDVAHRIRVVDYDHLARENRLDAGTWVLTALDQLSAGMQQFVGALHTQMAEEAGVRFLNHPTRTLRRFDLLATMTRLGRNDFRAVRASGDIASLRFPVFLRSEWDHGGNISPLLESEGDVHAAIARATWQGHRVRDLLVVEFCSTADAEGRYRKYGAYIVGNRIMPRHMAVTRQWMVKHAGTEFSRETILEEQAYVLDNPHEAELREIFSLAAVEYGRIDYAVKDGRIQVWEINLAPTIGRGDGKSTRDLPDDLRKIRADSRDFFFRAFNDAWLASDHTVASPAPIPISIDAATRRRALVKPRRLTLAARLRRWSQPLDALLKPVALRLLPLMARLVRVSVSSGSASSDGGPRVGPVVTDRKR
jgi:hypothetical protein